MLDKTAKDVVGPLAGMTTKQVRWARKQYASKAKGAREIARHFGVSITAVSFMLNRKTYQHVK
jgi:hypothetical protein